MHRQRFGFVSPDKPIEIETIEVEALGGGDHPREPDLPLSIDELPEPRTTTRVFTGGAWHDAPVYLRDGLQPGDCIAGPALIIEPHQTVVVEPHWQAEVTAKNHLLLTRAAKREIRTALGTNVDPVLLEVFNKRFTAIAEQMGYALQNTARSVNIKERLDFSCAIFDGDGRLVANAPHIPVHLGSMDRSVETVRREVGSDLVPGDVWMLNAPYNGGTHLPDITVVTPVFATSAAEILFFVAARGHHADIGGIAPGSMSPKATRIEEEGIYIDPFKLVEGGRFREGEVLTLLTQGPYPARDPAQNIADLKAQAAANAKGVDELGKMVAQYGLDVVQAYMGHVQDNAAASVARVIEQLESSSFAVETDTGARIKVAIGVDRARGKAIVDFTGTSAQQPDTFNAPEPITRACVLYVFRTLVDDDIPLNAGCLRHIEIVVPEGSMLAPRYPAAVAAGNVETSQTIVNCLYGALGRLGSAQGTMNNLTFGNAFYQYYETICSGAPAGPGFDGAAAVQTYMTNSRLTDPEVLELRYPVLLERFEIRRGSGGKGRWRAGDGTLRVIRFLERMECAILSGFRRMRPFGTMGGEPGEFRRKFHPTQGRAQGEPGRLRASDARSRRRDHHQDADRRRLRRSAQIERARDCSRAPLTRCLSTTTQLGLCACGLRTARPALGHELIELGLVTCLAQAIEESLELVSLLLQAPQSLLAIGIEGRVAGRPQRTKAAETAAEAPRLLHKVLLPLQFVSATHASTPDEIGQEAKANRPPDDEAENRGDDPRRLPVIVQGRHYLLHVMRTFLGVNVIHIHIGGTVLSRVKRRHKMLSAVSYDKTRPKKCAADSGNGDVAHCQIRAMAFQ